MSENINGHWIYPKEFDPNEWVGFIYHIRNMTNDRRYIGKKFFFSTTRKKIKGRINRKKVIKESTWKKYTSSSKELNSDLIILGKDKFQFAILSLHESKGSLAYAETEAIIKYNAIRSRFEDGTKEFYNGICPPVKFSVKDYTQKELDHMFPIINK